MRIRIPIFIALAGLVAASTVGAQVVHTRAGSGRAGSAAAAAGGAAPAPRVGSVAPAPTIIVAPNQNNLYVPPGMVLYGNLPVLVLPDGRIYADFGRGYEQIIRNCAHVVNYVVQPVVTGQPIVTQPVVVQPSAGQPVPIPSSNPVPSLQPPVQSPSHTQVQVAGQTLVNSHACWSANGFGQVFIAR